MNSRAYPPGSPRLSTSIAALLVLIFALSGAYFIGRYRALGGIPDTFEARAAKERIVLDMQVQLLAAAEAEKSAVMAETDEESAKFAAEAESATAALDQDFVELDRLVGNSGGSEGSRELQDFGKSWKVSKEVDHEILALAIENTNLKARRLSNGPARASLDDMQAALEAVIADASGAQSAQVARAAFRAQTTARKIHALHSVHIDEAHDAEMDQIEAEIKTMDGVVEESLGELASIAEVPVRDKVQFATTAYASFRKMSGEVLSLSRRNTNVRSLSVSLGQKRKVTAECQSRLDSLRSAIRNTPSRATR